MNKQAYLILAHGSIDIFQELLKSLDFKYHDIFIHIDKGTDAKPFENAALTLRESRSFFVSNRQRIKWGDYSIVQAELELFKLARRQREYRYYHLISGVDMPIKPIIDIFSFYDTSNDIEYIQYWSEEDESLKEIQERYRYYDFGLPKRRTTINKTIYHILRKTSVFIQKMIRIYRNAEMTFKVGSQWCSLTNGFVEYLLENETLITKLYKKTLVSDESFIQTLAYNSCWKDRVYENRGAIDFSPSKREILFVLGKPKIWGKEDIHYLIESKNLFARKFEDVNVVTELKRELERFAENG